jgi:hypothetical protein
MGHKTPALLVTTDKEAFAADMAQPAHSEVQGADHHRKVVVKAAVQEAVVQELTVQEVTVVQQSAPLSDQQIVTEQNLVSDDELQSAIR